MAFQSHSAIYRLCDIPWNKSWSCREIVQTDHRMCKYPLWSTTQYSLPLSLSSNSISCGAHTRWTHPSEPLDASIPSIWTHPPNVDVSTVVFLDVSSPLLRWPWMRPLSSRWTHPHRVVDVSICMDVSIYSTVDASIPSRGSVHIHGCIHANHWMPPSMFYLLLDTSICRGYVHTFFTGCIQQRWMPPYLFGYIQSIFSA